MSQVDEPAEEEEAMYDAGLLPTKHKPDGDEPGPSSLALSERSPTRSGSSGSPSREPGEEAMEKQPYSLWSPGIGRGSRMRLIQLPASMGKEPYPLHLVGGASGANK